MLETCWTSLRSAAYGKEKEQVARSAALRLSGEAHVLFVLGVGGALLNKKYIEVLV